MRSTLAAAAEGGGDSGIRRRLLVLPPRSGAVVDGRLAMTVESTSCGEMASGTDAQPVMVVSTTTAIAPVRVDWTERVIMPAGNAASAPHGSKSGTSYRQTTC